MVIPRNRLENNVCMINFFWGGVGDEVQAAVPLKVYLTSSLNLAFTQLKLYYIFIFGMAYSASSFLFYSNFFVESFNTPIVIHPFKLGIKHENL